MDETNTNASVASLNALFNGGGTNNLARIAVSTGNWQDSNYTDPFIYTKYINEPRADMFSWPLGVYYNFCAASAGSYCYSNDSGTDANEDICPAGWRMPTSGYDYSMSESFGEYATLYNSYEDEYDQYNQYSAFRRALRVPLSANFNSTSNVGYSEFWSSMRSSNSNCMYVLSMNADSNVFPSSGYYGRQAAGSVRCIMKND